MQPGQLVWVPYRGMNWPAQIVSILSTQLKVKLTTAEAPLLLIPQAECLPFLENHERFKLQSRSFDFLDALETALQRRSRQAPSKAVEARETKAQVASPLGFGVSPTAKSPSTRCIHLGVHIRIKDTDEIHHKFSEYANTEATICEVPVHPNTWYGVRLFDGHKVKIRRSGFDVIGVDPPSISLPAAQHTHKPRPDIGSTVQITIHSPTYPSELATVVELPSAENSHQYVVLLQNKNITCKVRRKHLILLLDATVKSEPKTLSASSFANAPTSSPILDAMKADPAPRRRGRPKCKYVHRKYSNLIGYTVTVVSGRYKGQSGLVRQGNNGYYKVELTELTPAGTRVFLIMKRCTALRVVPSIPRQDIAPSTNASVASKNDLYSQTVEEEEDEDQSSSGDEMMDAHQSMLSEQRKRYFEQVDAPESWLGHRVLITSGMRAGELGVVRRSSCGLHSILLDRTGEEVFQCNNEFVAYDYDKKMKTVDTSSLCEAAGILVDILSNGNSPAIGPIAAPAFPSKQYAKSDQLSEDEVKERESHELPMAAAPQPIYANPFLAPPPFFPDAFSLAQAQVFRSLH